ncbi:heme ABC transporter ATP-binding protein [Anditalea andensis]|uniref:heme ABC transporter ATP-binding protein n=1 Tax=Anditalea andensis TaxID=1048983 RepID=UPI001F0A5969|nr:heme ABC transporter ATP-binding protein [Anditalea andensis]
MENIYLQLNVGELKVVLGPNGAGKSSLFKILSGEATCKLGAVAYNGRNLQQYNAAHLAMVRSVMPQSSQLSFPFFAKEVVEMGLMNINNHNPTYSIQEVMLQTNTWHLKNQLYGNLSGGEKQRVQFSRALVQIWEEKPYPRYLLLDEPTSSMDISQQHQLLHLLLGLKKRNIGILVILHDLNLAALYADSLILLKEGKVIANGVKDEVLTAENLFQTFDYPIEVLRHPVTGKPLIAPQPVHTNFQQTIKSA